MPRRTKATIIIILLILLLVALAAYLRRKAPPEVARLLPESDCILYFNLRPLRTYTHFDRTQVPHDPQYQAFIDATGFEFERDLDEVAFGLHRMANPLGPNGAVAFSEVFLGHLDGHRLAKYFASIAVQTEEYAGHTIYDIPSQGRTVRVALLGYDMVAASNTPTPEQIHSMLDRYRTSALPFSGSSLLTDHYAAVPLLSIAWGLAKSVCRSRATGSGSWVFIFRSRWTRPSSGHCGGQGRCTSGSKKSPPRSWPLRFLPMP